MKKLFLMVLMCVTGTVAFGSDVSTMVSMNKALIAEGLPNQATLTSASALLVRGDCLPGLSEAEKVERFQDMVKEFLARNYTNNISQALTVARLVCKTDTRTADELLDRLGELWQEMQDAGYYNKVDNLRAAAMLID